MIDLKMPDDVDNFYVVDDNETAYLLNKAGLHPRYKDFSGNLYYQKNKKLLKAIKSLGLNDTISEERR